jgi:hypothetical protein
MSREEDVMSTKTKRILVGAMSTALILTSFTTVPVGAAPANKTPAAKAATADTMPTDISARRRHYRHGGGISAGQAAAMFGLVAGTVIAVSAARRHRHNPYAVPYAYGAPYGGYYGAPYRPYGYAPYGYGGYGYGPRYW